MKNIHHIFEDHVRSDVTKEEFRKLCKAAWEKQHGFVIIDLNIEVGFTSFTYEIQLKSKTNIIFALQNGKSS